MEMQRLCVLVVVAAIACGAPTRVDLISTVPSASPPRSEKSEPMPPVELVSFTSGALTLHGFLWRPAGRGPFPAIVFNHGSEENPGAKEGQAAFYVPRGFVVFVPHRRGHGRSASAGPYTSSALDAKSVQALVLENDDVIAAIQWVAALPYVDARRVATVGCSFGGIHALLAAQRSTDIIAAVDFAGGAMTWTRSPLLQAEMVAAARAVRVPVLFLQADNDYDTTPSRTLSSIATASGHQARLRIFPPNGTTSAEGHAFCTGGANPPWGDAVLAFLKDAASGRRVE